MLGTVALVVVLLGCNAPANDAAECAPGRAISVDSDQFGRLDIPPLLQLPVHEGEIRDGFEAAGFTFPLDEWRKSGGGATVFTTGHYPVREEPDAEMLRIVGNVGSHCPTGLGHIAPAEGTSHDLGMRNAHRLLLLLLTLPEWEESSEWLNAALSTAYRTGSTETAVQGTTVKLLYETRDGVDLYILTLRRPLDDPSGKTPTPVGTATGPPPTVETTLADLTVWRFCSGILAGTLEEAQLVAVYRLDESELNKDRREKLAVVRLLREQVDRGTTPRAAEVRELQAACQEVRRADSER